MTDKMQIRICWVAIIASILFLVIGVDYLPILACWMPLLVTCKLTFACDAFRKHLEIDEEEW